MKGEERLHTYDWFGLRNTSLRHNDGHYSDNKLLSVWKRHQTGTRTYAEKGK